MARSRDRKDPDRYIHKIGKWYQYKRRVPLAAEHADKRAPHVRMSLKTDDLALARRKRDMLEAADDALWASYIARMEEDPARMRYEAAVRRVEALDFAFHSSAELETPEVFDDLLGRLRFLQGAPRREQLVEAVLGTVEVPATTLTKAFELYVSEIVADELVSKSAVQKAQWKKVKQRAVNNFVALCGDKAMTAITVDDARKIYRHWLARIAPKQGSEEKPASASSGNRDLGNLRVLYEAYFRHMGDMRRQNPFDGFGFSAKRKKSRPPIPVTWISTKILTPGALRSMNDEARGIVLALIETGARPSEIANLDPTAIRLSHKVPHLAIEPREDPDNPREIKTESSRRLVPLVGVALEVFKRHPQGFPRYQNRENELSATVNKYFRANGLFPTKGHTLYSFRHSFEDRMKEADFEDELRRLIMGHTIDRPKYGSGGSLEWKQRHMLTIALPFDAGVV